MFSIDSAAADAAVNHSTFPWAMPTAKIIRFSAASDVYRSTGSLHRTDLSQRGNAILFEVFTENGNPASLLFLQATDDTKRRRLPTPFRPRNP
jgi:hypothetical protein